VYGRNEEPPSIYHSSAQLNRAYHQPTKSLCQGSRSDGHVIDVRVNLSISISSYSIDPVPIDICLTRICPSSIEMSHLLLMHDHTPVALNLARLPPYQLSPDRPRHRAHSISLHGDLYVSPLIPNLIHGANNCSRAWNQGEARVSEFSSNDH
jgi:hypothetical protein